MPTRLTGTATAGMMVARRLPRNRNTTITTRMNASNSVFMTSRMVSRTKSVESYITMYFNPVGNRADSFCSVACTAAAVFTALAPGAR